MGSRPAHALPVRYFLILLSFLVVACPVSSVAQDVRSVITQHRQSLIPSRTLELPSPADARRVFAAVEGGIAEASISSFAQYFASQVSLNLQGGETGSYSSAQAFYILDSYLRSRKPIGFRFSTIGGLDSSPFATGSGTFQRKGTWEIAQVYVSLVPGGDRWVISQINIY